MQMDRHYPCEKCIDCTRNRPASRWQHGVARKLRMGEEGNRKLKKLLAASMLGVTTLREMLEGNF